MTLRDAQLVDPHVPMRRQLLQLTREGAVVEDSVPLCLSRVRVGHLVPPVGQNDGRLLDEPHLALGREVRQIPPSLAQFSHHLLAPDDFGELGVLSRLLAPLAHELVELDVVRAVGIEAVERGVRLRAAQSPLAR
eukprot:scaffold178085_cov30-Tisochrysis_lutea.AAC.1